MEGGEEGDGERGVVDEACRDSDMALEVEYLENENVDGGVEEG